MESLTDDATGCYVVTTESGTRYWLDLNRRQLQRVPSLAFPARLQLRCDGENVDLVEVVRCVLGQPMVLLINLWVPGVWCTTRESTPVVRIDPVPEGLVRP